MVVAGNGISVGGRNKVLLNAKLNDGLLDLFILKNFEKSESPDLEDEIDYIENKLGFVKYFQAKKARLSFEEKNQVNLEVEPKSYNKCDMIALRRFFFVLGENFEATC